MTNTTTHQTPSTKTTLVHKKDEEGALIINSMTGHIQQPLDERPEWSEGLAVALLAERHGFYNSRLGSNYTQDMKDPEMLAYEDLGWIGVDAQGEPVELDADHEFRMEVLSTVLGIDREEGHIKGHTLAEIEMATDQERTHEEVAALEYAQTEGFSEKTGTK